MHETLIQHINSRLVNKLTEPEILAIKEAFKPKTIRKHQYFLQEGEICKLGGFIVKGALKQYMVDMSGKESVLGLYLENWWVGDRESQLNNTPSPYFIDVVETTELLVVTKEEMENKLNVFPFVYELGRVLSERRSFQLLKRVHASQVMTAEQRLQDLEKTYPEFLQRFPQHIVASYLGMTKETMSRIRSQAIKK